MHAGDRMQSTYCPNCLGTALLDDRLHGHHRAMSC